MLSTTRFNNATWQENCAYRLKNKLLGPIYCSPMKMRETIMVDTLIFVVEMNNEKNQIEGIGLIRNRHIPTEDRFKHFVYDEGNFNRYIYKGEYRIDRNIIETYNLKLVDFLDYILFKGKTHLKRGNGFMRVPDKLLQKYKGDGDGDGVILSIIKNIFLQHFNQKKEEIKEKKEK